MIRKAKITIKDVANTAGVSTQTVSRVLNNRPDVSPETREMVQKVIRELGYAPNIIARSLSSGKTNTIGVVGFGLEYYGPAKVLTGIEKKSAEYGYSVMLALLDQYDREHIEKVITQFIAQQVTGIIWAIPGFTDSMELVASIAESLEIPIILLNRPPLKKRLVLSVDNREGARLAVRHLQDQGYRHIGMISGPLSWWEAQERLAGWREIVETAGIKNLDRMVYEGDWTVESGDCGFEALYAANPDLDAIFVSNDQMSLGVIQAARRHELRIPEDLGIVGFDNVAESKFYSPALTTVHQPARHLGGLAVVRLDQCIRHEPGEDCINAGQNVVVPDLIVRRTSLRGGE
jgi:LacI family transcriptional regulator